MKVLIMLFFIIPIIGLSQDISLSQSVIGKKWETYYASIEGVDPLPFHPDARITLIINVEKLILKNAKGEILAKSHYQYNNESRTLLFNRDGEEERIVIKSVSKTRLKTIETDEFGDQYIMVYQIKKE